MSAGPMFGPGRARRIASSATVAAVLVAAGLATVAGAARAQSEPFPSRQVTIVVPYAAGGGTDALSRLLAKDLAAQWGQPVVVENRGGADGWIGTQRVLQQPADGHTLLVQLNAMLLWRWSMPEVKFDPGTDLKLVTKLASTPIVALVKGDVPAGSMRELFDRCRAAEKPCSFGAATVSAQLAARQLADLGGLAKAAVVPYKGTAPMVTDLLGGHIDVALTSANQGVPLHADGRAKALGVGTPARYPRLPSVPTFAEAGYPIKFGQTWYGVMVRAGTPDTVVNAISSAIAKAGTKQEVLASIDTQGGVPVFNSAEAFSKEMAEDLRDIAPIGEKYLK